MSVKIKVFGPPGCGKTYTLMQFYQECIKSGYKPDNITVISYRKSSALDLQDAVKKQIMIDDSHLKRHVGTLHSICYRLIGRPELMKQADKDMFIKFYGYSAFMPKPKAATEKKEEDEALDLSDIDALDDSVVNTGDLFKLYEWCRATCTPPEKYYLYAGSETITLPSERIPEFFKNYDDYKRKINKVDFSDMLQRVINENIQLDTFVLLVDEFQDLTPQMYRIFEIWQELCAITIIAGDPFQSIYGYAGGSPKFFEEWNGEEIILPESRRLPAQIKNFSQKILKTEGMHPPDVIAKMCDGDRIHVMDWDETYPEYESELHLIRCNYQAFAVAMKLAEAGKVFGGIRACAWTEDEVNLVNAIINLRQDKPLSTEQIAAVLRSFPAKILGIKNVNGYIEENLSDEGTQLQDGMSTIIKQNVIDILLSSAPSQKMKKTSKLFQLKINSSRSRNELLNPEDIRNRRIMTIHGSKGLEADGVFLHTAISPKIENSIDIAGTEESMAEARVWYVGATRAREHLHIVLDKGGKYELPPSQKEESIDTRALGVQCKIDYTGYLKEEPITAAWNW